MVNDEIYDLLIIGGGISSCVFVSAHIKNGFDGKIAIIENGRNLGGRSSTRISFTNNGWKLNHGAPSFNICNNSKNKLIKTFINDLLDSNLIQTDPSDIIELNKGSTFDSEINSEFYSGTNYISRTSMSKLSQNIIFYNNCKNQIDYFFKTLIVRLDYTKNQWILTSKNGHKFKTKFLICSSNLLLHKRSLDILNVNQIPLRKAIPINKDKKIDTLINLLYKQEYIQRLTFLIYTKSNYSYKDNYKNKYRYFILNKLLEERYKFERIIFQKQENNNLGIVVHIKNKQFINKYLKSRNRDRFKEIILDSFNDLFDNDKNIKKLKEYQDIQIMVWRASQPSGFAIPENLQVNEDHNIAFCGDWFDCEGFGRIEGAILSALKLSCKINSLY